MERLGVRADRGLHHTRSVRAEDRTQIVDARVAGGDREDVVAG
jgi:hypothetical protein